MSNGDKGHTSELYVWNGLMVFWGTSFHTRPHCHRNTLQLVFDLDKTFKLKDEATEWTEYSSAIIKASHTHRLDSNGSTQLFLYLDNDTQYAQKLTEKYLSEKNISGFPDSDIRVFSNGFFKKLVVTGDCDQLYKGSLTMLNHLIELEPALKDERVEKAISFISGAPVKQFKVKDVAEHVALSDSHLRHLFKAQVGQPIQKFILWMRVVDSLNLIMKGKQLTQIAHKTGFWDSSHMNRSYNKLLGVSPVAIKNVKDDFKIISCRKHNFYTFKTEILQDWKSEDPLKVVEI